MCRYDTDMYCRIQYLRYRCVRATHGCSDNYGRRTRKDEVWLSVCSLRWREFPPTLLAHVPARCPEPCLLERMGGPGRQEEGGKPENRPRGPRGPGLRRRDAERDHLG